MSAFSGFNRHELPPTTPDWTSVDHRRTATFATGELYPFVRASFELVPDIRNYVETVHRLNATGAVVTRVATGGASREGSVGGEWRCVTLVAVDGTRISRVEIFEETDLQPALARFEDSVAQHGSRITPRWARTGAYRTAMRDAICGRCLRSSPTTSSSMTAARWSAPGFGAARVLRSTRCRRPPPSGVMSLEPTILATRGDRLLLIRVQAGADQSPEAFHTHVINLLEVDDSGRFCVAMVFDPPDDLDAAFAELDSRFLAAEAATHADTWCVIAGLYAAFNRHEPTPPTNWVGVDHRRVASFPATDMTEIVATARGFIPNLRTDIASVHRLSRLGAVITAVARGTSPEASTPNGPSFRS